MRVAAAAGIGLSWVAAEYGSQIAAGVSVFLVWLGVGATLVLSGAFADLEPARAGATAFVQRISR